MTAMIQSTGSAPGKVILFGEHAVVYGRPALAIPVTAVRAEATIECAPSGCGFAIYAPDLGEEFCLESAPLDHPLASAVRLTLAHLGMAAPPAWRLTVHSTIPIAGGLGSGAAVSAAIVRALAVAAQTPLTPAEVCDLVYQVDRLHHGNPSGIDNTVISYEQPVFFVRGQPPQRFPVGRPFWLAIADTGVRSPTKITVGDVRRDWERDPATLEARFDRIAAIAEAARAAIAAGASARLGPLMDANHTGLQELGVSSPELDRLADAARSAGATGAKLSGGGRGGNLIALVTPETADAVADRLCAAGAVGVILTQVSDADGST